MPHSHNSGGCSGGCEHGAAGHLGEELGVQYRFVLEVPFYLLYKNS